MDKANNRVTLVGSFWTDFRETETAHGKSYKALFGVPRKSGFVDIIPVITFDEIQITKVKGDTACIQGRILTRESKGVNAMNKIITEVQASSISYFGYDKPKNLVQLSGTIVGRGHYRHTPKGKWINNFAVAVPRANGKTDLIHVLAREDKAAELQNIYYGEKIELTGRLQCRGFTKKSDNTKHRVFEVSLTTYKREGINENNKA